MHTPHDAPAAQVYTSLDAHPYREACSEPEEVLLDENKEAAKHSFYNTAAVTVSPDNNLLCYTEDTVGGEKYSVHVIDLATRKSMLSQPIGDCSGNVVWAKDSETLFWVKQDEKMRPYQARPLSPRCICFAGELMKVSQYNVCLLLKVG